MMRPQLQRIETEWPGHVERAIANVCHAHPQARLYSAAFWQFYCDEEVIHPPAFGANAEGDESGTGWYPPDWKWDVLREAFDGMLPLYLDLSKDMDGSDEVEWANLVRVHYGLIGRVTRVCTEAARRQERSYRGLNLSDKFFMFAIDVGAEDESAVRRLIRASVDERIAPNVDHLF